MNLPSGPLAECFGCARVTFLFSARGDTMEVSRVLASKDRGKEEERAMSAKRVWLLRALVLWLCVVVVACGDGAEVAQVTEPPALPPTAGVTVTPTAEPPTAVPATATLPEGSATALTTGVPTDTPTPTPTLTPETPSGGGVLDDLQQELFVSLGGDGDISFCSVAPATELLPAAEMNVTGYDFGQVCLWGFPAGSTVNVALYDPGGQFVAAREITVDDERDGVGVVLFELSFAGQPRGDWALVANSAGTGLNAPFRVGESSVPVISIRPLGSDPFTDDRPQACMAQNTYAVGDEVAIFGPGFPPGKSLPLGLYYLETFDFVVPAQLIYGQEVQADEQGRFEVHMPVGALALQGDGVYFAIIPLHPDYQPGLGWHGAECAGAPWISPQGAMAGFVVSSGAAGPTPTASPTPTRTPTFTPTPTRTPTPTPTPACALATASEFYPIWQQVRHRLGCPIGPFHTTWSAVERFERGWMYWREDEVRIYVMYDDGHWQDYPDTWHEGEPETAGLIPPAGLLEPKRGFGKVWRDHLGGPAAAIGWALEEERGVNSKVQDFAAGTMLAFEGRTYVLFRDLWSWSQR